MGNSNYRISRKALSDLRNIWKYTVNKWSEEQAERHYKLIIQEIDYLSEKPDSGRQLEDIKKGYRCSKVKSHFIFYRKGKDGVLEVVRILHQMMDIPNRLKE